MLDERLAALIRRSGEASAPGGSWGPHDHRLLVSTLDATLHITPDEAAEIVYLLSGGIAIWERLSEQQKADNQGLFVRALREIRRRAGLMR